MLGPCDNLFLSALDTRGGGGNLKYAWMVSSPESADAQLTLLKSTLATHDAPTLELAPGTLPAGHTFVFSVRVTSIWGSRDTATLTVETEADARRPLVTLQGPSIDVIDAASALRLDADASLPSGGCSAAPYVPSYTRSLSFQWTVNPSIYFDRSMKEVSQHLQYLCICINSRERLT